MSFLTVIPLYSFTTQIKYLSIYLFPSRKTSRSDLSGESDTDESLKKSSKKRKKKKKKHHHYKTKKKAKGDSSSSESELDTKRIKDKAATKYVLTNTVQDLNSLYFSLLLFFFLPNE